MRQPLQISDMKLIVAGIQKIIDHADEIANITNGQRQGAADHIEAPNHSAKSWYLIVNELFWVCGLHTANMLANHDKVDEK